MADRSVSIALTAIDKFSKPFKMASKSAGKLQEEAKQTDKTLKELGNKQKLITRFKTLNDRLEDSRQALSKAKTETDKLKDSEAAAKHVVTLHTKALAKAEQALLETAEAHGAESEQVAKATKEVKRLTKAKKDAECAHKKEKASLKGAELATARLTTSYSKQAKELGGLRRGMSDAGLKVNSLGVQQLKLAKQTEQANQALEQQKAKLQRIQKLKGRIADRNAQKGELVGQAVGLAVKTAPLIMAGKRAVEYESTFADVKKVVNFSDKREEAEYRTKMMQLAGRLGVEQKGIADIVTAAGQSGIEKKQLLEFAESATKMSVAWDVSSEEAGSTLATWRAAMGLTQENAIDLADSTNYLSNNMNAKAKDIAAVMVRQGSTAMGAGLDYNQTAALSATLIAGGATEEVASTALKNITGRLTAGYAATGAQKDAMNRIGFDADELAGMMQDDAQSTLIEVMRGLQDVNATDRGAVISQLFGEEVKGAVAKLVTTLDDDKNGLVSAFGKVANQADRANSVNDEYANRASTRGHQLSQLSAKFDRMTIVLGDRLLPVLDTVLPPLMSVVDGVANFAEANPQLATGLLGVVGALAAVKAGVIAFKFAKLAMGNGKDRFKLGREKLTSSTDRTAISANRASRSIDRLNRKLNGLGAGAGYGGRSGHRGGRTRNGNSTGRYTGSRLAGLRQAEERINDTKQPFDKNGKGIAGRLGRSKFGRYGRLAGLMGGGAALSLMSDTANAGTNISDIAMTGADLAGAAGGLSTMLPVGGMSGNVLKGAGKLFRPLDIALQGAGLASAVSQGDSVEIGATAGDMVGGLGGAAAGGMAGAAIGSVVPIVGTAIGGIIGTIAGGMGGGALGEWIGSNIGGWFSDDKTEQPAPSNITSQTQQLQNNTKSMTFAPTIHLTPTGNQAYDQDMADQVIERLKAEFAQGMMGNMDMATRADGSLGDKRTS
ncbi:phage tail tape measure protein [Marinomonas mediterranea]|uniref:phage tail tape measure protein n=1 Tax=Marinomonas mediterranea TaxID=119864 RepID=UPI00234AEB89|nr:phage tail tape measure protein [Marinomonas mediterranea]WCN13173.1 phage tail tape measure protein [Marinomonas mediterranea]